MIVSLFSRAVAGHRPGRHLVRRQVLAFWVLLGGWIGTWVLPDSSGAAPPPVASNGEVKLPLADYSAWQEMLAKHPGPAPAAYTIGDATVTITITEEGSRRFQGKVEVDTSIQVFDAKWVRIPLLPLGVTMTKATLGSEPLRLIPTPDGIAWDTATAGTFAVHLEYLVTPFTTPEGNLLSLPLPQVASSRLSVQIPGNSLDVVVIPATEITTREENGSTRVTALAPGRSSLAVSWRQPGGVKDSISRATYQGRVVGQAITGQAITWQGEFHVTLPSARPVLLPVLPSSLTLNELKVDGVQSAIQEKDGFFATLVEGRGNHRLEVTFQTPMGAGKGVPNVAFAIPKVPISRFDLVLPGNKELQVTPSAQVTTREEKGETLATLYLPVSDRVAFSWSEAVPETIKNETRANATLVHLLRAEEGVLHVQTQVNYEITQGKTTQLALELPKEARINRVVAAAPALLADWTVKPGNNETQRLEIYLKQPIQGELSLEVFHERLLGSVEARQEPFSIQLLKSLEVNRQRGVVALLSGNELSIHPESLHGLTLVGDNQIPPTLRQKISGTVAHTFKYFDPDPRLTVRVKAPQRKQGHFDAQIDTLISIGEVTLKGNTSVTLDVKSDSLMALDIELPTDLNVLGVTAPSLRTHRVESVDQRKQVHLEFTQEITGQFRLDLHTERIMGENEAITSVPLIKVRDAEVAHGRLAVEALAPVEVQTATSDHLSTVEASQLPQQLLLRTTNPILLAFKYVQSETPPRLDLKIIRHQGIELQQAVISRADLRSLITRDGIMVTVATFKVQNNRQQFLQLELPPRSTVWSLFVNGVAEKPAQAESGQKGDMVLIRLVNNTKGFPVELIYANRMPPMSISGELGAQMPRPNMVVTQTNWQLFLPSEFHYLTPTGSFTSRHAGPGSFFNRAAVSDDVRSIGPDILKGGGGDLHIQVPAEGYALHLSRLYAHDGDRAPSWQLYYFDGVVHRSGLIFSLVGVLLLGAGLLARPWSMELKRRRQILGGMGIVASGLLVVFGSLQVPWRPAMVLACGVLVVWSCFVAGRGLLRWWQRRRRDTVAQGDSTGKGAD
ncbi:MAG: hypothetical protein HQL64_03285 [Magnetococcales bacterium]|nr:hypothetical protein [Magnetococcales bacterium]